MIYTDGKFLTTDGSIGVTEFHYLVKTKFKTTKCKLVRDTFRYPMYDVGRLRNRRTIFKDILNKKIVKDKNLINLLLEGA